MGSSPTGPTIGGEKGRVNMEEAKAKIEIIKYLSEVLEKPSSEFGGLAPCPFARYERISGKLYIGVYDCSDKEFVEHVKETMIEQDYESAVYALFVSGDPEVIESELTREFQTFLNVMMTRSGLSDYRVICFNPEQDLKAGKLNVRGKSPFFLINVAKKDILAKAHKSLEKTDYYNNFSESYLKYIEKI